MKAAVIRGCRIINNDGVGIRVSRDISSPTGFSATFKIKPDYRVLHLKMQVYGDSECRHSTMLEF